MQETTRRRQGLVMRRTIEVVRWTVAGLVALTLPVVTLVVVWLLMVALPNRTGAGSRSLAEYLWFAAVAVMICVAVGVVGSMLCRHPGAAHAGLAVGWLVVADIWLAVLFFAVVPSEPPQVSWGSYRWFVDLLGFPLVFTVAISTYTTGFAVRDRRRRWLAVLTPSAVPGLVIALAGVADTIP